MQKPPPSSTRTPNIILVNCDDLGWGDLGCTGHPTHKTPHLDRLAAEGMRFTDFYMASPVCSPSRGAMMTGCYPSRIGFDQFDGRHVLFPGDAVGLNPDETTFAKLLQQKGYATQIIGKWHCGDQPEFLPTNHGFDHYYGIPFSNDMGRQVSRVGGHPLPLMRDERVIEEQPDQATITSRYIEEAVQFMRGNQDRPFLLYFAHMYVHLPLFVQERFATESENGKYGAAVACIDWAMGVLLHELKALGIDENTLVLFTSDNGSRADFGPSNGFLRGKKATCWEGGQRVPLLARWPGKIPPGTVCTELATSMDFLPTFARLAGTEPPADRKIDGKDILPLLEGEADAKSPHETFFFYRTTHLEAVRHGAWKLHLGRHNRTGEGKAVLELYNLQADPGETRNVADEHPEVVARLQSLAETCRHDLGDSTTGVAGTGCRPIGRTNNPKPLTEFNPDHPYYIAMYDLNEVG